MPLDLTGHVEGFTLTWAIDMGEPNVLTTGSNTTFVWQNGAKVKLQPGKGIESMCFPDGKPGYVIVNRDEDRWTVGIASGQSIGIHKDVLCS